MVKINLQTNDNNTIVVKQFIPQINNQKVVVIIPAMGVKQTFYECFANFLKAKSYTVYTFDYSGIGESKFHELKNYERSISHWANNDFAEVVQFIKLKHPSCDLILIGHSLGGQLIALSKFSFLSNKIILVSSQSGYWKFWNGLDRTKMFFYWKLFFPTLVKFFGYLPSQKFSRMENLPKEVVLEWANWGLKPNYFLYFIPEVSDFVKRVECPIFSYSSSDDNYAPKVAADWLASIFTNSKVIRRHLKPNDLGLKKIGHFGFFKEENKESIWKLLINDIEY